MKPSEVLRAWDAKPGNPERASAVEDLFQARAVETGIGATELRVRYSRLRRDGHPPETAWEWMIPF